MQTILIAENDIIQLRITLKTLGEFKGDINFITAPNGKVAYEKAIERKPTLILMDWNMPVLSGIESIKKLKKNENTRHIPVILVSANSLEDNLSYALESGAVDYIQKPYNKTQLFTRIKTTLKLAEYRQKQDNYIHEIRDQKEQIEIANKELLQQKDEIEAQRDDLKKAQQLIADQNAELKKLNKGLEKKVHLHTQELYRTYHELLNTHQKFDEFTYRSAHDLRGPIARLLGLCQVSLFEVTEKSAIDYLDKIEAQALEMNQLLSRLLRAFEINVKDLDQNSIDFENLINNIWRALSKNQFTVGIDFNLKVEDDLNFLSDFLCINILLENLIENAIQFRDTKKVENFITIDISKIKDQERIKISVQDNGIGVLKDKRDKIFDMFVIGSDLSKGKGLGLYEAKIIIEKLDGKIDLNHTSDVTEFVVELPYLS